MTKVKKSIMWKLKKLIHSSRPISWVNTAYPFAVAYVVTGGVLNTYFFLATFYFLIPYNILIYVVNDVFDYESDVKNPRKNSVEGGLLAPELHRFMIIATVIVNSIFLLPLLLLGNVQMNVLLCIVVFGAVAYSMPPLRFKERPFIDSVTSSLHFVGPMLVAITASQWQPSYVGYAVAFFLWGCASHMFGAVQDITADRQAKIASIATALGARSTVRLSLVLYASAVALLATYGWPQIIVAATGLLYCKMAWPYRSLTDDRCQDAHSGWRRFLWINQLMGAVITIILVISHYA